MASDVNELQSTLDHIARLASETHNGASDRKRTLGHIIGQAQKALDLRARTAIPPWQRD